jgi:FdhD protein
MKGIIKMDRVSIDLGSKKLERGPDSVAFDFPLEIIINGEPLTTLWTTPSMLEELVVGHLISTFPLSSIKKVEVKGKRAEAELEVITSKREVEVGSKVKIELENITRGVEALSEMAEIFLTTGGTHAAALYTFEGELIVFVEDVGRHNTFDKAIGYATINGIDLRKTFITSTARQNRSMVEKAARSGIPMIASRSAPSHSGVEVAESAGITLICFVREDRLNVYTHPERILF